MQKGSAKRFYQHAGSAACDGGFVILLDDRKVNTPLGEPLIVPGAVLAEEIAAEWRGQGTQILPGTMPMMRLACTAIDKVRPHQKIIIDQVSEYGANDLLCYRAAGPDDLVARQAEVWQPLLDWAAEDIGANLQVTSGIVHVSQPDEAIEKLRQVVEIHDGYELTALAEITQLTGSLVLGLAVSRGRIDGDVAFEASQLDETWQNEHWGEDYEATDRKKNRRSDLDTTVRFLTLVRS